MVDNICLRIGLKIEKNNFVFSNSLELITTHYQSNMLSIPLKYMPLVCFTSYVLTLQLITPSIESQKTVAYLENKFESLNRFETCPSFQHEILSNQTILFDNFYDYTLYVKFSNSMKEYYATITPFIYVLVSIFFISLIMSLIYVIRVLTYF